MRYSSLIIPAFLLALGACGGDGGGNPGTPTNPAQSSHNAGRDCLQCHNLSMAGTVYRADGSTAPGAVVRITSAPGGAGDVVVSLTADASGNFYTDQAISWGDGLYADATGPSGTPRPMEASLSSGACNSCHGPGSRITAD